MRFLLHVFFNVHFGNQLRGKNGIQSATLLSDEVLTDETCYGPRIVGGDPMMDLRGLARPRLMGEAFEAGFDPTKFLPLRPASFYPGGFVRFAFIADHFYYYKPLSLKRVFSFWTGAERRWLHPIICRGWRSSKRPPRKSQHRKARHLTLKSFRSINNPGASQKWFGCRALPVIPRRFSVIDDTPAAEANGRTFMSSVLFLGTFTGNG